MISEKNSLQRGDDQNSFISRPKYLIGAAEAPTTRSKNHNCSLFGGKMSLPAECWDSGTFGRPLGDLWETFGRPLGDLWETCGDRLGDQLGADDGDDDDDDDDEEGSEEQDNSRRSKALPIYI